MKTKDRSPILYVSALYFKTNLVVKSGVQLIMKRKLKPYDIITSTFPEYTIARRSPTSTHPSPSHLPSHVCCLFSPRAGLFITSHPPHLAQWSHTSCDRWSRRVTKSLVKNRNTGGYLRGTFCMSQVTTWRIIPTVKNQLNYISPNGTGVCRLLFESF